MKKHTRIAVIALAGLLGLGEVDVASWNGAPALGLFPTAEAVVGHPLTPGSYAGVARRTTRRVIRRGAYVATIPHGCPYGTYYGYSLYYCGGTYYQKSGGGYVIVYF